MKNKNEKIKKAFDLYIQNEIKKIPSDENINLEFTDGYDTKIENCMKSNMNRKKF